MQVKRNHCYINSFAQDTGESAWKWAIGWHLLNARFLVFSKCFPTSRKRKAVVCKSLRFAERSRKVPFSSKISVDGRPVADLREGPRSALILGEKKEKERRKKNPLIHTYFFYLILWYAHMKIFLLYMRNISFIFILLLISCLFNLLSDSFLGWWATDRANTNDKTLHQPR